LPTHGDEETEELLTIIFFADGVRGSLFFFRKSSFLG